LLPRYHYVGKPTATGQPTRPTQSFILPGSINDWVAGLNLGLGAVCFWHPISSGLTWLLLLSCVTVCVSCHCCPAWQTIVCCIPCVRLSGLS